MLYSPILSFLKLIILIPWIITISFCQFIVFCFSKRFFFVFYKFLFFGIRKIFGIKLKVSGEQETKRVMFISNHISYLDIIILGSLVNAVFVAKSDIRNWPIINKLCMLGKTIFVERENRRSVKKQAVLIKENMENGFNVILFPEGTSSDGSKVLSFKSSLFEVVDHKELRNYKLQPISISYNKLDGLPLVKTHRPFLAWFGAMNLAPHFWQFLGLGTSEVNISFHKSEKFSVFLNRKEACKYCFERISEQVKNDYQLLEVDNQIKLNEFKFL